jgi:hypothetical protein
MQYAPGGLGRQGDTDVHGSTPGAHRHQETGPGPRASIGRPARARAGIGRPAGGRVGIGRPRQGRAVRPETDSLRPMRTA